ncbi:hypothetical protein ACGFWD_22485 [Streptomyces sp. NPDC048448]|uniref:hypothetical protein n=1 Tax=unclassified Streptomyces TaxID=2593676 RepID=UPI00143EEECC|nr:MULTISPECIES: hypothetical protein [unclassified Streptomyces]QIY67494.1 hypothetical protein HEP85_22615 [Streptomyces sp. RPA4-2]
MLVAAGLAGALMLTGCSSDDSGPSGSGSAETTASPGGSGTGGTGGDSGTSPTAKTGLEGSWLATTGGKAVALVITGKQAGLFATGGTVCTGTAGEEAGMRMIHLTCTDGNKQRATGMVDSVNGTTLKVTWSGGLGKESYTKAQGGKLPSGLPTANLGS